MPLREKGFTRWNVLCLLISQLCGLHHLYAVVVCTSWGSLVAFHTAFLVDRTSIARFARTVGLSPAAFLVANLVFHAGPCLFSLIQPVALHLLHGLVAAALHVWWGVLVSQGTMRLDDVYVPMSPRAWKWMWTVSIVVEIATPSVFARL